jgi:hypothetical protein
VAYAIFHKSAIHAMPGVVVRHLGRDQGPQPAVDVDGQPVHDPGGQRLLCLVQRGAHDPVYPPHHRIHSFEGFSW